MMPLSIIIVASLLLLGLATFLYARSRKHDVELIKDHPYFTRLLLWPKGEHTRWEAEIDGDFPFSTSGTIGVLAEDNYSNTQDPYPTDSEIDFCKRHIQDFTSLVSRSMTGLNEAWQEWFQESPPASMADELVLDGFSVPMEGREDLKWGVTFFCERAGHFFSIEIRDRDSSLESIDG